MPPIEPGEYTGLTLRKPPAVLEVGAVDRALEQLQQRAARWHPVEDRPARAGDTLLVDLDADAPHQCHRDGRRASPGARRRRRQAGDAPERLDRDRREANPPGFDEQLTGTTAGDARSFTVDYPRDYEVAELAGATVDYAVTVKGIRRKELLPLDDDFAKEVSDVETLEALRDRVREDLQHGAEHEAEHRCGTTC